MSVLVKDPDSTLDFFVDWSAGYLDSGEIINAADADSEWTVTPSGSLSVTADSHDTSTSSVTLSGGVSGNVYRVTNQINTSLGRIDDRSIVIRVQQQ